MSLWSRVKAWLKSSDQDYSDFTSDRGYINSYLIAKARGEGNKGDEKLNRRINKNRRHLAKQRASARGKVVEFKGRKRDGTTN